MTSHHHQFTAAPIKDGYVFLCYGCDAPRSGPLAYCPSCEEVTESYQFRDDGSIRGADLSMFEAETLDMLWNGSLGMAPTTPVGMRGVGA